MEEQKNQWTTGLSAVYQWDEKRSLFLAADQWTDAFFVFVNPFHARHIREQRPVKNRLIRGLSPGREALFVPGC